jgi:hypothetical protein
MSRLLDRAVANSAFTDLFQDVWVENVITTASDHMAISISLSVSNDLSSNSAAWFSV